MQTRSSKLNSSSSQEPVAQADPALQLSPPWLPCPTLEARVGRRVPSQLLSCYITWKGAGEESYLKTAASRTPSLLFGSLGHRNVS